MISIHTLGDGGQRPTNVCYVAETLGNCGIESKLGMSKRSQTPSELVRLNV